VEVGEVGDDQRFLSSAGNEEPGEVALRAPWGAGGQKRGSAQK